MKINEIIMELHKSGDDKISGQGGIGRYFKQLDIEKNKPVNKISSQDDIGRYHMQFSRLSPEEKKKQRLVARMNRQERKYQRAAGIGDFAP